MSRRLDKMFDEGLQFDPRPETKPSARTPKTVTAPLWLADTYDNLPDYTGRATKGTTAPINENWHSPFRFLQETVEFVRNIPKTPETAV